jgi:hypothetical protein
VSGQVTTLAGTGQQGDDKVGGKPGVQQPLSTPWDVAVGVSPGKTVMVSLIVMMMMMMIDDDDDYDDDDDDNDDDDDD